MFTGLISACGQIHQLKRQADLMEVDIAIGPLDFPDLRIGESICVNGICLTVVRIQPKHGFVVQAMKATYAATTMAAWKVKAAVNLERALAVNGRLDGHWVSGHVDGVGRITEIRREGGTRRIKVMHPAELGKYIAAKGSIALDGVSLTVGNKISAQCFSVSLIPYTLEHTTLHHWTPGRLINLETDILARYVEQRLASGGQKSQV